MADAQRAYLLAKYGGGSGDASTAAKSRKSSSAKQPAIAGRTISIVDEDNLANAGIWNETTLAAASPTESTAKRSLFKKSKTAGVFADAPSKSTAATAANYSEPASPPRRRPVPTAASPPRRPFMAADKPLSPPRRPRTADSPPPLSPSRLPESPLRRRPQMESGAGAGLQTAESVRLAVESKQARERERLGQLDQSESGRGAATIYRDKHGRLIDPAEESRRLAEQEKERERRRLEQIENLKGQQQLRQQEEREHALRAMESAPFSRHADDEEINRRLKGQVHWDDPMRAEYGDEEPVLASQMPLAVAKDSTARAALRRKRLYRGGAPPNRFNILPGYRWDGVDRSNGFEATWFRKQAERSAKAVEAYKWSTEDM